MKKYCLPALLLLVPVCMMAQLPATPVAKYKLDASATDIGGSAYNGALVATAAAANRFGTASRATAFTSGVSSGALPIGLITAMQNDFSIGFWFKTSMTAATGTQWYNGNSLVDAEVGGVTNDWGICLIDGGKVCFGIGNPDITIKSSLATYNNNAWHFVMGTRNKTTGTITLYVDGSSVASSGSTSTTALNAPLVLGLGRSSAVATGNYTGSLDDIFMYNRALSAAEVSAAYSNQLAVTLPLQWVSFTGSANKNTTTLQWETTASVNNDYFDIEQSTDGMHFTAAARVADKDFLYQSAGNAVYRISITAAAGKTQYYRIKQVDTDGRSGYSKTLLLTVRSAAGLSLQTNPVAGEPLLVNNAQEFITRIDITDMNGRMVKTVTVNSNSALLQTGAAYLQPGAYIIKVSGINTNQQLSLIKQ